MYIVCHFKTDMAWCHNRSIRSFFTKSPQCNTLYIKMVAYLNVTAWPSSLHKFDISLFAHSYTKHPGNFKKCCFPHVNKSSYFFNNLWQLPNIAWESRPKCSDYPTAKNNTHDNEFSMRMMASLIFLLRLLQVGSASSVNWWYHCTYSRPLKLSTKPACTDRVA